MVEKSKKQQYVVAVTGTLFGLILLVFLLTMNIPSPGNLIILIFGVLFGGGGIVSFFNPTVFEVLGQIMKNMADNAEKQEVNQKQISSTSSPQTGHVHGDQHIHIENSEKERSINTPSYNKVKIENRLNDLKSTLISLLKSEYKNGGSKLSAIKKEIKGIIFRIYSKNPEAADKRLIHRVPMIATSGTSEKEYQEWFIEDVEGLISTIDIIIREMDLD